MIYKTLKTLPKVIQIEILDTGNVCLLDTDISEFGCSESHLNYLSELWENIQSDFNEKHNKQQTSKLFNIYKEMEFLEKKYTIIKSAIDSLDFDINEDLIALLQGYGYRLTMDNYNEDLKRIDRESEAIIIKINKFIDQLPKKKEGGQSSGNSIISNMGAFITILGVDFDFYTISVEKYHVLEDQVKHKVAAIEKQNSKNKK